jgi:hypothetical protein
MQKDPVCILNNEISVWFSTVKTKYLIELREFTRIIYPLCVCFAKTLRILCGYFFYRKEYAKFSQSDAKISGRISIILFRFLIDQRSTSKKPPFGFIRVKN